MTNAEYLHSLMIIKDEIWDAHYELLSKIGIDYNDFIYSIHSSLKIMDHVLEKEIAVIEKALLNEE